MPTASAAYSLPRWRLTRWLVDTGPDVPHDVRVALVSTLYGTLPIFAGGVCNTIAVSVLSAIRVPTPAFIAWVGLEAAICLTRLVVLRQAMRRAAAGQPTPTDLYLVLGLCWAASVGYGAFISMVSGDWIVATLSCLSAAAMVGGTCFRNFGAPRMAALMIALSLGPTCPGAVMSGQPIFLITLLQIPFYLVSMTIASFRLNALLVKTIRAERDSQHLAHHDALTGLSNRSGLAQAIEAKWRQQPATGKLALFYLDLDGFKAVNDTFGHAAGDRLLELVAGRLRKAIGPSDCAARIGGDEFILVCEMPDLARAQSFGDELVTVVTERLYEVEAGMKASVGVTIGVALSPDHGEDLTKLMSAADRALYGAKALGGSRCAVAGPAPGQAADLQRNLRQALGAEQTTASATAASTAIAA
jgi:diguanylate cyclase (GGDEF)-like protein